jgi:hypothetical protein
MIRHSLNLFPMPVPAPLPDGDEPASATPTPPATPPLAASETATHPAAAAEVESNPEPAGSGADAQDDCDAAEEEGEDEPGITLDQLHEELIATTTEARRGNRRTLEVLKNFGAMLDALSATVNDTHKSVRALPASLRPAAGDESGELAREWALALVELADRLGRVAEGFDRPPAVTGSWWPGAHNATAAWREAWARQADAFDILRSHLESLLKRAALMRLEVVGKPFDPATMTAVESAVDPAQPDHTVLAEILPGWQHAATRKLLRPAQVRVSRHPTR